MDIYLVYVEDAIDRHLASAKSRGNRCCQTSVTSEKSRKSLLPDACHQRKIDKIAAARCLSITKTRGYRCCQTDRFFVYSVQFFKVCGLVGWFCCFTSQVNIYGHCGTVSSPNHTFSWAGLNKRITSNSCTYFRL